MLDRTCYTTRTDLTMEEIMAIVRVRTALETGEISAKQFQMNTTWKDEETCGSVGCIGGWAGHYMEMTQGETMTWMEGYKNWKKNSTITWWNRADDKSPKFKTLFWPSEWVMYKATPADGIRAINNFLANKSRPWAFMRKDGSHAR